MGRPPCCDKIDIKKGPWTAEEDIILVSYIQEHGPGNWRSVPINTGLLRCSKSCRLRWANYLRPGIKRGNFTPHEEAMIIHLQALLGNRWASIASYLSQRTDNDVKNYWNTHIKKKMKKLQAGVDTNTSSSDPRPRYNGARKPITAAMDSPLSRFRWSPSIYASSTENISKLLEGWMRASPTAAQSNQNSSNTMPESSNQSKLCDEGSFNPLSDKELESMSFLEHLDEPQPAKANGPEVEHSSEDHHSPPLSTLLERWLLDESPTQMAEFILELSADCCSN